MRAKKTTSKFRTSGDGYGRKVRRSRHVARSFWVEKRVMKTYYLRKASARSGRELEMNEILARIRLWTSSDQEARAWYRSYPIAPLGYRTAEALVATGQAADVRDYLDHVAIGSFA